MSRQAAAAGLEPNRKPAGPMSSRSPLAQRLPCCVVLFLATFLVHFTRLHEFGLWEDDYWSIAPNLGKSANGLGQLLQYHLQAWHTGRPLNHFLPAALSIVGSNFGGLTGVYVVAMAWLGLNACLVFGILGRLVRVEAAFAGALAYLLFPADTTKILLVHAAHIQGAMTFLLLGILLWVQGNWWRAAGYLVAGCSLLSYETAFLPFLAVPLLMGGGRKWTLRTWGIHIAACTVLLASVAWVRMHIGDARAAAVIGSPGETIHRALTSLYLGPATSTWAFPRGIVQGWNHLTISGLACALLLAGLLLAHGLVRLPPSGTAGGAANSKPVPVWPGWLSSSHPNFNHLPSWWLTLAGILVWSGCYVLTLVNYPPTQFVGRFTSTHIAAAWPAALVFGGLSAAGLRHFGPALQRTMIAAGLLATMCLTSYHHFIQAEYIRAWEQQKLFWRQVMELSPDATAGWTIIVFGQPTPGSTVIAANSWADYHVCRLLFAADSSGTDAAFAHLGHLGSIIQFQQQDGHTLWKPQFWGGPMVPIDPARLAILEATGNKLHRVAQTTTNAGPLLSSAPIPAPGRTNWPDTPLARLMFPERFR